MEEIIKLSGVNKLYKSKNDEVCALSDVNLTVYRGEIVGVIGFSGAGKSTLVRCINALETPDSGNVTVLGKNVNGLKTADLLKLRRKIGMIFQGFNLLQQKTVLKNVAFPLEVAGVKRKDAAKKAEELLKEMGLGDKLKAYPAQLSGGQKQRDAIARALANDPEILLCDEATSALDAETSAQILKLLKSINETRGITVVIIAHQLSVIKNACARVAVIDGGKLCETGAVEEVFSNPQTAATKRLLAFEGEDL